MVVGVPRQAIGAAHNESLMSRCLAVWVQDWDGPHDCGRALIRSHRPRGKGLGGVDRSITGQRPGTRQPVHWVRIDIAAPFCCFKAKGVAGTTGTADVHSVEL